MANRVVNFSKVHRDGAGLLQYGIAVGLLSGHQRHCGRRGMTGPCPSWTPEAYGTIGIDLLSPALMPVSAGRVVALHVVASRHCMPNQPHQEQVVERCHGGMSMTADGLP